MERPERTVIIAHRDALMGRALLGLLESMDFSVVATVSDARQMRDLVAKQRVGLVLVDANLHDVTPEMVGDLSRTSRVAVVGRADDGDKCDRLLRAGAVGLLSSDLDEGHFRRSLELLLEGDLVVSKGLAPSGISVTSAHPAQDSLLSEREREVLGFVAKGMTNREIAEQLIVTEHTVKVHLRHILEKLDLRNRQQAAAYAVQNGLIGESASDRDPMGALGLGRMRSTGEFGRNHDEEVR